MAFTKLDDGLIFSSLMREDDSTFKVWILLLSLTKQDGIAPVSSVFLETITGKSSDEIDRCLNILSNPDARSRTPDNDGRRIRRVDGGFLVLNHGKYRAMTYLEHERMRKRSATPRAPAEDGKNTQKQIQKQKHTCPESSGNFRNLPEKDGPFRALVDVLMQKIQESGTGAIIPAKQVEKWEDVFRLMVEIDHRTTEQIAGMIEAVFRDAFWCKQIRSADNLRKKWNEGKLDRLNTPKAAGTQTGPDGWI